MNIKKYGSNQRKNRNNSVDSSNCVCIYCVTYPRTYYDYAGVSNYFLFDEVVEFDFVFDGENVTFRNFFILMIINDD